MKIAAHRGLAGYYLENSKESFNRAIKCGSDILEVDIRFTKDLQPIVMHDERLDRTTQSRGLVRNRTLKELQEIKLKDNSSLMNLSDFIEEFSHKDINFILDIKDRLPEIPEVLIQFIPDSLISKFAVFLHFQLLELFESFSTLNPKLKLYGTNCDHYFLTQISKKPSRASYLDGLNIPSYFLTEKLIKRLKRYNPEFKIVVDWSIHRWLEDIHYPQIYENLGVDIIITEYPNLAKGILEAFANSKK